MFSFGLVASSDAISGLSEGMDTFQMILDFINIIILFVICFLINYTTKFMFTKRSREFGMYLLLGIRRGKVIRMFLLEILLLGLFALALSFPAGFMISQVISLIIVGAFGIPEVIFITFDHASAGMLILYFAGVCLLVLLNTGRKMRRISIRGFLDMEKENEKKMLRSAGRRNLFFCISILLGVLGFLVWNSQFDTNVNSDQSVMYWLMFGIVLFIISIYGVSVTAGDMLLTLVLRKTSVKYTGDHLFIARTFSSKVRSISVTMGTLSMLVVLTLLSLNVSYLNQGLSDYTLELEAPYDVDVYDDYEDREVLDDYISIVEEDYHIEETFTFDVCKEPKMQLFPITGSLGSNTDFDPVISLSTYNTLLEMKGREAVFLADDEYIILADRQLVSRFEETSADLAHKLRDEMSWHLIRTDESGEVTDKSYKVSVRGQSVEEGNSLLAIVSSLCLYLAFIFLSTAGAILAVQALSDASRHKYRYTVLSRLGVSDSRLYKTVGKQLLILFGLPVVYPVIITFLCMTSVNRLYSMLLENSRVYLLYFLAGLGIFLLVYLVYFAAAYIGFKRNIQEA